MSGNVWSCGTRTHSMNLSSCAHISNPLMQHFQSFSFSNHILNTTFSFPTLQCNIHIFSCIIQNVHFQIILCNIFICSNILYNIHIFSYTSRHKKICQFDVSGVPAFQGCSASLCWSNKYIFS